MDNTGEFQNQIFRLVGRQNTIAKKLDLIGPSARSMYVDACRLIEMDTNLQSEALLVGHLVREIESTIRSVLMPITNQRTREENAQIKEKQQKTIEFLNEISFPEDHHAAKNLLRSIEDPDSHKKNIRAIVSILGLEEDDRICELWLNIPAILYKKAHRRGLAKPERIDNDFEEKFWSDFEFVLLGVLNQMEKIYVKFPEKVDEIRESPSKGNASFVIQNLPNNFIIQRRFFEGNSHKEWIPLLKTSAIFTQPPSVEPLDDEEYINPPHWPAMDYLKDMASIDDKDIEDNIVSVIQALPEINNVRISADIVEIAITLPLDKSLLLEEKVKQAISDMSGSIFMRDFSALIKHWMPAGEKSLEFANWLFDVEPNDDSSDTYENRLKTRFRDSDYKATIDKSSEFLLEGDCIGTLQLFCELLNKAMDIECKGDSENDYSHHSRPDISESNRNSTELSALIDVVRDCSVRIVSKTRKHYSNVSQLLEAHSWRVFRRLEMHLLSSYPKLDFKKLEAILVNRKNFDDSILYYEYKNLAKAGFEYLSENNQKQLLAWLEEPPDLEDVTQWYEENKGRAPTDADLERISAIRFRGNAYGWEDALPAELQKKYSKIVEKYGEEEPPNKVSSLNRGPDSPQSTETIEAWTTKELIQYLETWEPEEGFFMPSMGGLGRELRSVVSSNASKFSEITDEFKTIHPTYICSILGGFGEALKQEIEINWLKILDLCLFAAGQSDESLPNMQNSWDADETWRWCKHESCRLLSLGFNSDTKNAIPENCRELAWELIEKLLEDESPSPEEEQRSSHSDKKDYYGLAINSTRGQVIEIIVHYCLRLKDENEGISLERLPRVKKALERHLDPIIEPSKSVKAVYGRFFPWLNLLDKDWASNNRDKIFLRPLSHDPAWRTLIGRCKPYSDCYDVLKTLYEEASEELNDADDSLEDPYFKCLCQHIVMHALRSEDEDGCFDNLLQNSPEEYLTKATKFIGQVLTDNVELPEEWKQRIQSYFGERIAIASPEELSCFGWWFPNDHLEPSWMLAKLLEILGQTKKIANQETIIGYLLSQAANHTKIVLHCLENVLFENDIDYWVIQYKHDDIAGILAVALHSGDNTLKNKAIEIVNTLVSKGHENYEELLRI